MLVLLLVSAARGSGNSAHRTARRRPRRRARRAATARGGQNPARPRREFRRSRRRWRGPGAALAAQSAHELGRLRFDAGEYPGARAAYEIAIAKAGSTTVRTLARASIAAAWEAQGDFPKAIDAYTAAVAGDSPGEFYYEDLLVSLARTQELAGARDAAIATYKRLLKEVPKLRRETEFRVRSPSPAPPAKPHAAFGYAPKPDPVILDRRIM